MPLLSNLPALRLTVAYALSEPTSLLPHHTISTLLSLPLPVSTCLPLLLGKGIKPTIKALVLDKDNTICPPESTYLHKTYLAKIEQIKSSPEFAHSPHSILVVSNTAGSSRSAEHEAEAKQLEADLGLPVLRQQPGRKKPLCGPDVLKYFSENGVTDNPSEIAFVGDRLTTDVLVARQVGAWSIWCRDGWRDPAEPAKDFRGLLSRTEDRFERFLRETLDKTAPLPLKFHNRP